MLNLWKLYNSNYGTTSAAVATAAERQEKQLLGG